MCQCKNLSPQGIFSSTHSLKLFLADYYRLGSSERISLKLLQLSIHIFKEVSRQSLGSLCPVVVYSDRMIAFHYQINSFPKDIAKLVNGNFS